MSYLLSLDYQNNNSYVKILENKNHKNWHYFSSVSKEIDS